MDPAEPPLPLQHQSLLFTPLIVALSILCFAALSLLSLHLLITKLFSASGPIGRWCSMSGADKKLLDSIPIHAYARATHGASRSEDHECPVCLAAFEEGEPVRLLPVCRHVFHAACIDAWLALHSNCPLCRLRVAATEPVAPPVGGDIEEGGGIASAPLVRSASSVWPVAAGSGLLPFREKLRLKRSSSMSNCFSLYCNSEHDAEPHISISVSSSSL